MTFTHGMAVKHVNSKTSLYVEFVDGEQVTCTEFSNGEVHQTITVGAKSLEVAKTDVKSIKVAPQFEPGQQVGHIMDPRNPMWFEYKKPHANPHHSIAVCSTMRRGHLVTFEFDQRSLIKYEEDHQYSYPKIV